MKKLSFIMILLFCATFTYAQKGKVTQAISYFTSGKLDQAKKLIDEAITHEACVNWDKAYFTKGQIYQAIFESQNKDYKKLDSDALNKAWEAYQKVIELDVKKKYDKKLETQYTNLIIDYTNDAVSRFSAQDFAGALASFKKVLEIRKTPIMTQEGQAVVIDTAIIFNAGIAAQKSNKYDEAEKYYKEAISYNYELGRSYAFLVSMLKAQGKEEEAAKYLIEGYEKFPGDSYLLVELINHYLLGKNPDPEKAEKYLDEAIKQDPKNTSFYRAKAGLYEKMEKPQQALEYYEKALAIDPNDYIAQYSIGNLKLTDILKDEEKLNAIADVNEYNAAVEKVYKAYEVVVPYFEKALALMEKSNDQTAQEGKVNSMKTLKGIYFKLRNRDPKYQQGYDETVKKLESF